MVAGRAVRPDRDDLVLLRAALHLAGEPDVTKTLVGTPDPDPEPEYLIPVRPVQTTTSNSTLAWTSMSWSGWTYTSSA